MQRCMTNSFSNLLIFVVFSNRLIDPISNICTRTYMCRIFIFNIAYTYTFTQIYTHSDSKSHIQAYNVCMHVYTHVQTRTQPLYDKNTPETVCCTVLLLKCVTYKDDLKILFIIGFHICVAVCCSASHTGSVLQYVAYHRIPCPHCTTSQCVAVCCSVSRTGMISL